MKKITIAIVLCFLVKSTFGFAAAAERTEETTDLLRTVGPVGQGLTIEERMAELQAQVTRLEGRSNGQKEEIERLQTRVCHNCVWTVAAPAIIVLSAGLINYFVNMDVEG